MPALPSGLSIAQTSALTRRVTALSVVVATVLIVIKTLVWQVSGSVAVLASLADSALDLVASLVTFFAVRYAAVPPDAEHRYGHGKAEAFASLVQAALVLVSAALVGREAVARLLEPQPIAHESWALGVMLISLVLTGLLITAQTRVLRRTGSVAVSGDRAHYFADVATNLVALVGIAGAAFLGVPALDAAAAIVVVVLLAAGAYSVFRQSSRHLMDHELPESAREQIRALLSDHPAVKGVHQLRTRASGPYVHIQAHVDLDASLSLVAAHAVLVEAERRVLQVYPAADIILHPDPRGRAEPHGGAFAEPESADAEGTR
jgi:ferrous-iron efflux pump FieF